MKLTLKKVILGLFLSNLLLFSFGVSQSANATNTSCQPKKPKCVTAKHVTKKKAKKAKVVKKKKVTTVKASTSSIKNQNSNKNVNNNQNKITINNKVENKAEAKATEGIGGATVTATQQAPQVSPAPTSGIGGGSAALPETGAETLPILAGSTLASMVLWLKMRN